MDFCKPQHTGRSRGPVALAAAFLVAAGCVGKTALPTKFSPAETGGSGGQGGNGGALGGAAAAFDAGVGGSPDGKSSRAVQPDLASGGSLDAATDFPADAGLDLTRDLGIGDTRVPNPDSPANPGREDTAKIIDGGASDGSVTETGNLSYAAEVGSQIAQEVGGEVRVPMLRVLAGRPGGPGSEDGIGTSARFNYPGGIASDGAGNLFVADTWNHTIRKIVIATGAVTTLAGLSGTAGSADGAGAAARFQHPGGIASDRTGSLFVGDADNHTIRKIVVATGVVTTLAGSPGAAGSADGIGSAANFYQPGGLAIDGEGNLFVADTGNYTVRRIVIATGAVTTLAGSPRTAGSADGVGAAASFYLPMDVASDGMGNLFITEDCTIRKVVVATGAVTTFAGAPGEVGSTDGTGAGARFGNPVGVASDGAGNLFVADSYSNTIRKIVISTGAVTTLAGAPGNTPSADGGGIGGTDERSALSAVAIDGEGNLFVVDDQLIRKVVIATGEVTTFAGSVTVYGSADGVGTSARFAYPEGVASDGAGSLFIANGGNQTIRKVDLATGTVTTLAGLPEGDPGSADGTGSAARFNEPNGLVCDGAGSLFVADSKNDTIRKIDIATGTVTTLAGLAGNPGGADGTGSAARFTYPEGLTSDGAGSLFVADSGNNLLRKVVIATGEVTTLASTRGGSGGPNGPGSVLQFDSPSSVVSDGAGNLYVADSGSYTIRKVVIATGEVTILAGSPKTPGSADGTGTNALFDHPWNLAIDNVGNLFVADRFNHTIRKIVMATGTVTTVVGTPSQSEVVPGPLPAKLACPAGLAVGPAGDLFITDGCENVVLVAQF